VSGTTYASGTALEEELAAAALAVVPEAG
jgi:hypothetical protein